MFLYSLFLLFLFPAHADVFAIDTIIMPAIASVTKDIARATISGFFKILSPICIFFIL